MLLYLQAHEFDELRFDVSISNNVWYLRAETKEDRVNWIDVLQSYKVRNCDLEMVSPDHTFIEPA